MRRRTRSPSCCTNGCWRPSGRKKCSCSPPTSIARPSSRRASGVYPASIAANVSEERLARYFTHDPQRATYRIQKHIRDLVIFSEQDVIKDPPFSRLDLLSCRNLLIYLNPDLQRRLMTMFHYALAPNGTLFLGTSETVGDSARLFQVVDRKWKIYTRLAGDKLAPLAALPDFVPAPSPARAPHAARGAADSRDDSHSLRQLTERALLAHSNKAGVMVDARGRILHIVGRTGKYLEPAAGDASMNILEMARDGLRRELTVALHRAVAHREPVSYAGLWVKANGEPIKANFAVQPIELGGRRGQLPGGARGSAGAARHRGRCKPPSAARAPASKSWSASCARRTNTCRPRWRRWRPPTRN